MSVDNLRAVIGAGCMVAATLWEGSSWPCSVTCPGSVHDYELLVFSLDPDRASRPEQPFVADEYGGRNAIYIGYTNIYGMESSDSCTIADGSGSFTVTCGTVADAPPIRKILAYRKI